MSAKRSAQAGVALSSRLLESCGVVHPQRDRVGQGQMPQLLRTIHLRKHPRAARRCRQ